MRTALFQSCGHSWVFRICWHTECSTFTASSFIIWNSSAGIPSPPLALLVVILPKAHLSSHSRMSDSRWVITPSWLSGSLRSFLYSSSLYYCHLFLISSASGRSCFGPLLSSSLLEMFPWLSLIFFKRFLSSIQLLNRVWLCDPMDCSMPGFPVHHQLPDIRYKTKLNKNY